MFAHDYTTGASASITYSAEGASEFLGNADSLGNLNGFFTGLMTEQYHSQPYYGNEKFVSYSNHTSLLTSAWLWIAERNIVTHQIIFSQASDSLISFSNYHQLHEFASNGASEYADAYVLNMGVDPVSLSLSATPILADAGIKKQAQFTASASGGTAPYTYLVFLDNELVSNSTSSKTPYSSILNLGSSTTGGHQYYVDVVDSKGYPASSQTITFTVNPDPTLIISSQSVADQGQVITISSQKSYGTPPYTTTLYLNDVALPQTNTDSATMTQLGQNDVYVKLTDAA